MLSWYFIYTHIYFAYGWKNLVCIGGGGKAGIKSSFGSSAFSLTALLQWRHAGSQCLFNYMYSLNFSVVWLKIIIITIPALIYLLPSVPMSSLTLQKTPILCFTSTPCATIRNVFLSPDYGDYCYVICRNGSFYWLKWMHETIKKRKKESMVDLG